MCRIFKKEINLIYNKVATSQNVVKVKDCENHVQVTAYECSGWKEVLLSDETKTKLVLAPHQLQNAINEDKTHSTLNTPSTV